jgi:aspartate/methionine/tyrosine aminotransferase
VNPWCPLDAAQALGARQQGVVILGEGEADDPLIRAVVIEGSFFMLASYERVSDEPDSLFVQRLIRDHGVATIPVSAFYHDGTDQRVIRLSFSKDDDTLLAGAERLCGV